MEEILKTVLQATAAQQHATEVQQETNHIIIEQADQDWQEWQSVPAPQLIISARASNQCNTTNTGE